MSLTNSSARLVALSAWVSRIIGATAMLYSIRALSHALSAADYAVFIILAGLMGWFALGDLGLGYAAQNAVTQRVTRDQDASREIVCAYMLVFGMAFAVAGVLYLVKEPIAATLFAKIPGDDARARVDAFFYTGWLLVTGAAAAVSTKVLYAVHRGYIANVAAALSSATGVICLVGGISSANDKVMYAIMALYGPNVLLCCVFCVVQLRRATRSQQWLPSVATAVALVRSALGFFVFYFMAAAVLQVDYLVMSQKVAPAEIIQYYSLAKLFAFASFFNQAILFAAWPRMTAQYATGEHEDIKRLIGKLVLSSSAVVVLASLAILISRNLLVEFVAPGSSIELRPTVILGFSAIALLRCVTDPFAIFLQSVGRLKTLIVFAAAQAIIGGVLQWTLAGILGIEGILIALAISFAVTVVWGLPVTAKRLLSFPPSTASSAVETAQAKTT